MNFGVIQSTKGALDALCEWVNQNWSSIRKQDAVSLLISMAMVDFLPSNWEFLWLKIKELVQEELKSPSLSANVHLDVAWSLTVLNHLEPAVAQSVLNDSFIAKVLGNRVQSHCLSDKNTSNFFKDQSGTNETGVKIKLNHIWAANYRTSSEIKSNLHTKSASSPRFHVKS